MKKGKKIRAVMSVFGAFLTLALVASVFVLTKKESKADGIIDYFKRTSINKCNVSLDQNKFDWTGSAIEPKVTVSYDGNMLTFGEDYTLKFKNNVDAGDATVTVKGINDFRGSATYRFRIMGISIKDQCVIDVDGDNINVYYQDNLVPSIYYDVRTSIEERPMYKVGNYQYYQQTISYKIKGKGQYYGSAVKRVTIEIKKYEPSDN